MQIWVYVLFLLLLIWLLMIWPGRGRKARMEVFQKQLIAHRGIHDNHGPVPENTLPSFSKAVETGYGIELDVRETGDEMLVISHDDTLKRSAGIDRLISEMTWKELKDIRLFQSEERIPRFEDALMLIGGKVPLVVEIKCENSRRVSDICEHVAFYLDAYEGPMCVESFNPMVVRWFRKNRPETLRGQLSENFRGLRWPKGIGAFLLSCCAADFLTKPDFIVYNWKHAGQLRFRILKDLFHVTTAAWTVKQPEILGKVASDFDFFICEGFLPEEDDKKFVNDTHKQEPFVRDMKNLIRKHMIVSGTVTAVGFRYRATWIAQALGVTGWVRNTLDERVEMEIQGTREMLDDMMTQLGQQRFIEITDVDETVIPVERSEYEFKVRG